MPEADIEDGLQQIIRQIAKRIDLLQVAGQVGAVAGREEVADVQLQVPVTAIVLVLDQGVLGGAAPDIGIGTVMGMDNLKAGVARLGAERGDNPALQFLELLDWCVDAAHATAGLGDEEGFIPAFGVRVADLERFDVTGQGADFSHIIGRLMHQLGIEPAGERVPEVDIVPGLHGSLFLHTVEVEEGGSEILRCGLTIIAEGCNVGHGDLRPDGLAAT